jgi:NRPS condensation-like uncharacterized protein
MNAIPQRLPAPALDQMAYQFSPLSDGQIRCVLRFDGALDAERLARAFRLSLDAEPVLGCRFVVRRGRCDWARRADLNDLAHCPVAMFASQERLDEVLEQVLLAPLDPFAGPPVTGRLLRGATDTLIVKINHFAADGFGLLQFLRVLAAIYGELGARPGYQPTPNLASRGRRCLRARDDRLPAGAADHGQHLPRGDDPRHRLLRRRG